MQEEKHGARKIQRIISKKVLFSFIKYDIVEVGVLRYKKGKMSKKVDPIKEIGKDHNQPLGHKQLLKFQKQIRDEHHIDIGEIITGDDKLK